MRHKKKLISTAISLAIGHAEDNTLPINFVWAETESGGELVCFAQRYFEYSGRINNWEMLTSLAKDGDIEANIHLAIFKAFKPVDTHTWHTHAHEKLLERAGDDREA